MLQGRRVRLRSLTDADLERLWQFNNDLEVELAGGGDPPMPQSLARLRAEYEQDAAKGGRDGLRFAIEADGQFIGQCALFHVNAVAGTAALGITIGDKRYWGQGYGRESIGLLVEYGFLHHNLRRIWLEVYAGNVRAQRAYAACGFREEGRLRAHVYANGAYEDVILMGLLRSEWEARSRLPEHPTPP